MKKKRAYGLREKYVRTTSKKHKKEDKDKKCNNDSDSEQTIDN